MLLRLTFFPCELIIIACNYFIFTEFFAIRVPFVDLREVISLLSEIIFFLKVCVKLAALSAEWPGRRKTYGPVFFFQAEDGIRDRSPSRGLRDVYKRQQQIE